MELKVYCDRLSQPSRAILIFCKANGIEFEEVKIDLGKGQHLSAEYEAVNPIKLVPAIVHGDFKLFESHAILIYLASAFPGVAHHWYPADIRERAKVHAVLDWHHSNLRRVGFIFNNTICLAFGIPANPEAAAKGEKLLSASLARIETFWLQEDGPFLLGNAKPTIADLALVCEIMQLEAGDKNDRDRILSPHKRVVKWMEDVKSASAPHFQEVHAIMGPVREKLEQLKIQAIENPE
ncbi:glutathione transferase [Salvia divinorum]|uniref:glutathione transferase n=1 Tax=Salvia divinorum TaxID=28513 RepID=A0ABD1HB87_SALDI